MPEQSRVGDDANIPSDTHGKPCCPHNATGPGTKGSPTVFVNAKAALRVGDSGKHSSCCGSGKWENKEGSSSVFFEKKKAARKGDKTKHCGGDGKMIAGSCDVIVWCKKSSEKCEEDKKKEEKKQEAKKEESKKPKEPKKPEAPELDDKEEKEEKDTSEEEKETIKKAIEQIKASDFGKTPEGQKVVRKLKYLAANDKIGFEDLGRGTLGTWDGSTGELKVNSSFVGDVDGTARELVHEATHAVHEDEFPASRTKLTIDEEYRANVNQLDLYEEQRARGHRDIEMERRRNARLRGTLRDDVRRRYPSAPEHL